jgi:hypothetical protein
MYVFVSLAAKSGSADIFPVIMAAIVKAVDQNGDLLRLAIATPGNDFRLGVCVCVCTCKCRCRCICTYMYIS